jgi:hypothetical protein
MLACCGAARCMFGVSRRGVFISYLSYKQDMVVFLASLGSASIQVKDFLYSWRFSKFNSPPWDVGQPDSSRRPWAAPWRGGLVNYEALRTGRAWEALAVP